jgi:hypothetical protein
MKRASYTRMVNIISIIFTMLSLVWTIAVIVMLAS